VEPSPNVPQFKIFPTFNIQFHSSWVNNLTLQFPPFNIFLTWVFKPTAPQSNPKWGFHSAYTTVGFHPTKILDTKYLCMKSNQWSRVCWHMPHTLYLTVHTFASSSLLRAVMFIPDNIQCLNWQHRLFLWIRETQVILSIPQMSGGDRGNIKSFNLNNRYNDWPASFRGPLLLKLSWFTNQ
jgi:hypothetical protein